MAVKHVCGACLLRRSARPHRGNDARVRRTRGMKRRDVNIEAPRDISDACI